jgi:phospholipid/cholesterol/gamma-HCH transport system ATP-binding protein
VPADVNDFEQRTRIPRVLCTGHEFERSRAGCRRCPTARFPGWPRCGYNARFRISAFPMSVATSGTVSPTCPTETAVQLTDVSFGYDRRRPILRSIDMTIPRGKLIAIMGGSGCGKTTILRLIGGQLRPQRGSVTVAGKNVASLDRDELFALRRKIGMLFQFGALFTDMTVFENIAFPLREHTELPEELIRNLVLMKLNAVGLRGAAQLRPSELSGGMARRVALARAIALDPLLVMYDEPFAGLDPISLGIVGQLIRKLNDALGITSVVVTHDIYESLKIVDYIYFVAEGRIVAQGTPEDVRASTDPFVRQFVDGEPDGPVPFHYPAKALSREFARAI